MVRFTLRPLCPIEKIQVSILKIAGWAPELDVLGNSNPQSLSLTRAAKGRRTKLAVLRGHRVKTYKKFGLAKFMPVASQLNIY